MLQDVVGRLVRGSARQPARRNVGLVVIIDGRGSPLVLDDDQLGPAGGERQSMDRAVDRPLVDGAATEGVGDPESLQDGELLAVAGVQSARDLQDLGLLLGHGGGQVAHLADHA